MQGLEGRDLRVAYHGAMLVSENRGQVAGKVELP